MKNRLSPSPSKLASSCQPSPRTASSASIDRAVRAAVISSLVQPRARAASGRHPGHPGQVAARCRCPACREGSRIVRGVGRIVRRAQVDELGLPGWRCVSELELRRQIASRPAIGSPRGECSGRTWLGHASTCLVPGPGVWGPVVPRPVPARGVFAGARQALRRGLQGDPPVRPLPVPGSGAVRDRGMPGRVHLPQACTGWPTTPGDPCPPGRPQRPRPAAVRSTAGQDDPTPGR